MQFPLHTCLSPSACFLHTCCVSVTLASTLLLLKDYGFCPLGCAICFKELYLASITWALRPQASSQVSHLTCSLSQLFLLYCGLSVRCHFVLQMTAIWSSVFRWSLRRGWRGGRVLSLCLHFKSGNLLTIVLMCNSSVRLNTLSMMTVHFFRLGFTFSRCQHRWLLKYPPPRTILRQWWFAIWTCLSPFFRSTLPHSPRDTLDAFLLCYPLTDIWTPLFLL